MFRPLLEKTFELKRAQAEALGYPQCAYDALLDDFEPSELTSNISRVLSDLRQALVPLVSAIAESQRRPDVSILAPIIHWTCNDRSAATRRPRLASILTGAGWT